MATQPSPHDHPDEPPRPVEQRKPHPKARQRAPVLRDAPRGPARPVGPIGPAAPAVEHA